LSALSAQKTANGDLPVDIEAIYARVKKMAGLDSSKVDDNSDSEDNSTSEPSSNMTFKPAQLSPGGVGAPHFCDKAAPSGVAGMPPTSIASATSAKPQLTLYARAMDVAGASRAAALGLLQRGAVKARAVACDVATHQTTWALLRVLFVLGCVLGFLGWVRGTIKACLVWIWRLQEIQFFACTEWQFIHGGSFTRSSFCALYNVYAQVRDWSLHRALGYVWSEAAGMSQVWVPL
jgi:hypothetical protein